MRVGPAPMARRRTPSHRSQAHVEDEARAAQAYTIGRVDATSLRMPSKEPSGSVAGARGDRAQVLLHRPAKRPPCVGQRLRGRNCGAMAPGLDNRRALRRSRSGNDTNTDHEHKTKGTQQTRSDGSSPERATAAGCKSLSHGPGHQRSLTIGRHSRSSSVHAAHRGRRAG